MNVLHSSSTSTSFNTPTLPAAMTSSPCSELRFSQLLYEKTICDDLHVTKCLVFRHFLLRLSLLFPLLLFLGDLFLCILFLLFPASLLPPRFYPLVIQDFMRSARWITLASILASMLIFFWNSLTCYKMSKKDRILDACLHWCVWEWQVFRNVRRWCILRKLSRMNDKDVSFTERIAYHVYLNQQSKPSPPPFSS